MILSMTGYGFADKKNDDLIISVEIRSVNSRFLDFSPRLPKLLIPYEDEAYKIIKLRCVRGRVTLSAKIEYISTKNNSLILNHNKLQEYFKVIEDIQKNYDQNSSLTMGDIIKLPEIFSTSMYENDDELKVVFFETLNNALNEIEENRINEGRNIESDILMRIQLIKDIIDRICSITKTNQDKSFLKYKQKIQDLIKDVNLDESRLYQEIAILSDKRDITEELVRLNSHFDLFQTQINSDESNGKKINFLLQEIGREVNTIASKTDIIEINHMAVDMKNELEKIREQVQNIV